MDPPSDLTPPDNPSHTRTLLFGGAALACAWAAWAVWTRSDEDVPVSRSERRLMARTNPMPWWR